MKIITLEEHYTDKRIMDANNAFNKNQPKIPPERAKTMKFLMSRAFPGEKLLDFEKRIAFIADIFIVVIDSLLYGTRNLWCW